MAAEPKVLVRVEAVKKHFPLMRGVIFSHPVGVIKAVDGISFDIRQGETLGLVGESGCGKSTTGRVILQLQKPTSGRVFLEAVELTTLDAEALRRLRPKMQMIFQDSYAALNPRHSVGKIVAEPLAIHGVAPVGSPALRQRVAELLELVGLDPAYARRFPHEFSGGQRLERPWSLLLGQAAALSAVIILFTTRSLALLTLAYFLQGSNRVFRPIMLGRLSRSLDPTTVSFGFGFQQTAMQMGLTFSPYVAGLLYARQPSWPLFGGVVCLTITMLLTLILPAGLPMPVRAPALQG